MYVLYSFLFAAAFVLMLPVFFLKREKYSAGFRQRLGNYPAFNHDERKVIWLHCVSVGETNAARPLVDELLATFPSYRLIVSTTTKTGQELAQNIFKGKADAVFYFPFDFKFSVRSALANFKPSVVLLMETEIWPRFFREAHLTGAKIAIVNGRLSAKSFRRYLRIKSFIGKVLSYVDLALMQDENDARRIDSLGIPYAQIRVTGNIKFDLKIDESETSLTEELRMRFAIGTGRPLIIAASTHSPEEDWILQAFRELFDSCENKPRLLIAPRHPQRFDEVAEIVKSAGFSIVRRSETESENSKTANVILLDSIGELRAVYPLATMVFVGGSLIPHGGQSVLEPAAAGKAVVTGAYTHNFDAVVRAFLANKALIQLPSTPDGQIVEEIYKSFEILIHDPVERDVIGGNAAKVMIWNRGATARTLEALRPVIGSSE